MSILYNCHHDGDQYRITKFDDDQNPISSYLTTVTECDCPAGRRLMCRHREMLPMFIVRGAVDNGWWYDYDRGGWVDMRADVLFEPDVPAFAVEPAPKPYRKPNDGRRV